MTPTHYAWSVTPWRRFTTEPPTAPPVEVPTPDGRTLLLSEPLDPAWVEQHERLGAAIHDERRGITYRATVDPVTLDLDHLEVELSGFIDAGALARLDSVPLDRIRREVRAFVLAERPRYVQAVLPGGLADGDGSMRKPPTSDAIASLLAQGFSRSDLAAHYGRPVRTIDGWIRRARAEQGEAPRSKREPVEQRVARKRADMTTDGAASEPAAGA